VNERETSREQMPHDATRWAEGPTQGTQQGTLTGDPHRGPTQRGPTQGTQTGDPHRGEGPTEDPPPERRATQGTHTGHTQTRWLFASCIIATTCGQSAIVVVWWPRRVLAFTRYSFSSRPLYKNQYYYLQTPPLFGHLTPPFIAHTIA